MKKIIVYTAIAIMLTSSTPVFALDDGLTLFERQFYLNSAVEKLLLSDEYIYTGEWIDDTFYTVVQVYTPVIPYEEVWVIDVGKEFAESIVKVYQSICRVWKDPIILRFSVNEIDMDLKRGFQISRHDKFDIISLMESGIEVFSTSIP